MRPPCGVCVPVVYVRCRDGDTIEVTLRGGTLTWAVRLVDCWCPERKEVGGIEATEYAESVLRDCDDLYLFIPCPNKLSNLVRLFSFDRVVGQLWVSPTQTLNEMLIEAGYATRTKPRGVKR